MIFLRDSQIDALMKPSEDMFLQSISDHVHTFSPDTCLTMGRKRVLNVVKYGKEKALRYGFNSNGAIQFFIECMFSFGSEFDTDPILKWASEVFNDTTEMFPEDRIALLYEKMGSYSNAVYGADRIKLVRALVKVAKSLQSSITFDENNFDTTLLSLLYQVFPEKCTFCGDLILKRLIYKGKRASIYHTVSSLRGTAIVIFCMFLLGHRVLDDQIYFWIGDTLSNSRSDAGNFEKEVLLEKAVNTFLKKTLTSLVK